MRLALPPEPLDLSAPRGSCGTETEAGALGPARFAPARFSSIPKPVTSRSMGISFLLAARFPRCAPFGHFSLRTAFLAFGPKLVKRVHYECMRDATVPWFEGSTFTIGFEMPRRKKDDSSFGPRFTAIRKARGLTQIRLAEAAGTTQRSNDDGAPPASAIIALSSVLSRLRFDNRFLTVAAQNQHFRAARVSKPKCPSGPGASWDIGTDENARYLPEFSTERYAGRHTRPLKVSADELLGLKPPRVERVNGDGETKRLWKRFQMVTALPEKDRRAVIRLMNSLAAIGATRKNSSLGERNA